MYAIRSYYAVQVELRLESEARRSIVVPESRVRPDPEPEPGRLDAVVHRHSRGFLRVFGNRNNFV